MRSAMRLLPWLLVLALAGACGNCGKGGAGALAELIPAETAAVVMLPNLAHTIGDINDLIQKFSVGPVATFLNQAVLQLKNVVGFDATKVEEWKKLGLDPALGVAIAGTPSDAPTGAPPLVVLGLSDAKAFEAELHKRAKDLIAADVHQTATIDSVTVHTLAAKAGDRILPRLHYLISGRFAALTRGDADPKEMARVGGLRLETSLAKAPWYTQLTARLSPDADVLVLLNGDQAKARLPAEGMALAKNVQGGLGLAFSASKAGLGLRAFVGLTPEAAGKLNALTEGVADTHLERLLPADTVLALKGRVSVARLLELALSLDANAKAEFEASLRQTREALGGVDVKAATLDNLGGNGIFGLSVSRLGALSKALREGDQAAAASTVGVTGWLQIKDAQLLTSLLEKALSLIPADAPQVTQSTVGGFKVFGFTAPNGVAGRLYAAKDLAGFCAGAGCEERAVKLSEAPADALPGKLTPQAKALFNEPSFLAVYVNFGAVVQGLQDMDASSLGDGGMLVKIMLDLALTAVKNLESLAGLVRFTPEGVILEGHLQLQ